jgi:hypothetical protein
LLYDYLVGAADGIVGADGLALCAPIALYAFHHQNTAFGNYQAMPEANADAQPAAVASVNINFRHHRFLIFPIF